MAPTAGHAARPSPRAEAAWAALVAEHAVHDALLDPLSAGEEGDGEALARLPDTSSEAGAQAEARRLSLQAGLARVDPARLSAEHALDHALLSRALRLEAEASQLDLVRIAFENDWGFHTLGDHLGRTTVIASRADAEAWLSRLAALPAWVDQHLGHLQRGIDTGFTQPTLVVDRVLEVARAQAATPPEASPLLLPFAGTPRGLDATEADAFRARALELVRTEVLPRQQAFVAFLEQSYLPAARPSLAWRSLPDGETSYRFLVQRETTTDLTPDEIHALGLAEVARIRGLMEADLRASGFPGDLSAWLAHLRTEPRYYASSADELLRHAAEIAKRADDRLPALFGRLPRLPYGVRPVPDELAEGYTTARYWPGSPALGRAGGYMVNTSHLDQRPLYELPALTLHEAVPGHHLQIALAQELTELPAFRRHASPTAYVEGWALYAEFLGEEMGMYRTPEERFGRWSMEMWRACRLVADTGIHWLGWDLEQARTCFTENTALSPHNIQTELERYVSWPAQALAYKVGELTILRLRREAEAALGDRFDVRAFHDVILGSGALPLDVLEQQVQGWVATQREQGR
ncbi:MAG: DUF885 domain-containing protein [Alphaproteobacteria bacterium]|nr:DUF885 domain-containing protein [Alphaproteobacteria bacterium]